MKEFVESKIDEILSFLREISIYLKEQQERRDYKISKKKDNSLITDLDVKSHLFISQALFDIFGKIGVISEEGDDLENEAIYQSKESFFLLDPIDGTLAFIENKDFSINLSFCINQEVSISFISLPKEGKIYFNYENILFCQDSEKKMTKVLPQKMHEIVIGSSSYKDQDFMIQNKDIISLYNQIHCLSAGKKFLDFIENRSILISNKCHNSWDIVPFLPFFKIMNIYHNENQGLFLRRSVDELFFACHDSDLFDKLKNR